MTDVVEVSYRKPSKARKLAYKPRKRTKGKRTHKACSLKKADKLFSNIVRQRDKKCLFPDCGKTEMLQCSHYIGRAVKSTRFDLDNCITLCWMHHYKDKTWGFEYQKQIKEIHGWDGQYTIFMRNWLGEDRFKELLVRSVQFVKQKDAINTFIATTLLSEGE